MRAFVISLLVVSAIAVNAGTVSKNVEKRGVLPGDDGYVAGAVGPEILHGGAAFEHSGSYLPPAPPLPVVKKSYSVLPATTYGVASYAPALPASTYGVSSLSVGPSFATSVLPSVPAVGVHGHLPVGHISGPATSYGIHSYAPASVYGVPAVSHTLSAGALPLGAGHLSTYGVPTSGFGTLPAAGHYGFHSKTYGIPSTGLALGHVSVGAKSYGVPAAAGYSDLSVGSINFPSTSYGVPSYGIHGGHSDGYSYPVPSNKLLV